MRYRLKTLALVFCPVVALGFGGGCSRPATGPGQSGAASVSIKGSDTMVHLVSAWAEAYMAAHSEASVAVTGGGSGTGIAALLNGTTEVCMASRDINAEERKLAAEKGLHIQEFVVARDGIAVVVHPANPVGELTRNQLAAIFTGEITDWSAVGGPVGPILVLSRESSSGTYAFFQEHVLNKRDFVSSARLLPATSGIIQAVSTDASAIGYVGLGYVAGAGDAVKALSIKPDEAAPAVVPSVETVVSGAYPIARALFLYTASAPTGALMAFVDFCLGPEGQAIVQEAGYVPVS